MNTNQYYVDKTSGTSADTLLAIGFASLLSKILEELHRERKGILIRDAGPYYEISLPISLSDSDLQQLSPFSLLKPLVSAKQSEKQEKQGKKLDGFDYEGQQQQSKDYREKVKQLPPHLHRPEARWNKDPQLEAIAYLKPAAELGHYQAINQMKIASSFNELAQRWAYLENLQHEHIHLLLTLFSSPHNDIPTTVAAYQKLTKEYRLKESVYVTALQIVNPTTGKGANYPKASELTRAIGNQDRFWLLELLKFVGFMHAAAPFIIQGSKDRKTYVLQPEKIELSTLQAIMREFREVCWSSTAIKLDIMASLRFTQTFVQHRKTLLEANLIEDPWDEPQVISVAQGFEAAFYKDMGSAYATMNIATINLPTWLPKMKSLDQVKAAEILLDEHIHLIQQIRNDKNKGEEGAEEHELLRFYRDFLSGRDLRPFWKFTAAYSGYLISQREHEKNPKRHIRQLTIEGLERLIMGHSELTKIISSEGFQNIADAIRQSTVIAQRKRNQLDDRTYEIRYGLGQELMRKARYPKEFMVALCEFLHQYEAETAQEEEKAARDIAKKLGHIRELIRQDRIARRLRRMTTDKDIKEVAELIDQFGSELVCSMLVAYGYARHKPVTEETSEHPVEETSELASTEEA